MPKFFEQIKHTVDATIPDKEELTHGLHPKIDYALLIFRNLFVVFAALLFILSFVFADLYTMFKAIGYFCGAAAYLFECLAVTDCFGTKSAAYRNVYGLLLRSALHINGARLHILALMGEDMTVFESIYEIVQKIPKGRVATYGQVASLAGNPRWARVVGYALHVNPLPSVIPCYRVVNREGKVAASFAFGGGDVQRQLLESEGIIFEKDGTIDLKKYGWKYN